MLEEFICIEIHGRKLQKGFVIFADVLCRCSLKRHKGNGICSNSAQKLLVQRKEFCLVTLQAGLLYLLRVERLNNDGTPTKRSGAPNEAKRTKEMKT